MIDWEALTGYDRKRHRDRGMLLCFAVSRRAESHFNWRFSNRFITEHRVGRLVKVSAAKMNWRA